MVLSVRDGEYDVTGHKDVQTHTISDERGMAQRVARFGRLLTFDGLIKIILLYRSNVQIVVAPVCDL